MKTTRTQKTVLLTFLLTLVLLTLAVVPSFAEGPALYDCKMQATLNRQTAFSSSQAFATMVSESKAEASFTAQVYFGEINGELKTASGENVVSGNTYTLAQISSFVYSPSKIGSAFLSVEFISADIRYYITINTLKFENDNILYTSSGTSPIHFDGEDFATAALALSGSSLDFVTFTLPNAKDGKLVYSDGTKMVDATSSTKFSLNQSPKISDVSFVPASTVTTPIVLTYKGQAASQSKVFTGSLRILPAVSNVIEMKVSNGGYANLDREAFKDMFYGYTGEDLITVTFTPSGSGKGSLNYGIESKTKYQYVVDRTNNEFRYAGAPYLAYVGYIANSFTKDEVDEISFVANGSNGVSVGGTLKVSILSTDPVVYTQYQGQDKAVDPADFVALAKKFTDEPIKYVTFTQQKDVGKYGILLYVYQNASETVLPEKHYSPTESLFLKYVTYRPSTTFTGTCSFSYTAFTETTSFGGTIEFNVLPSSQKPPETTQTPTGPSVPTPVADPIPADPSASERKDKSSVFTDVTATYAWGAGAIDWLRDKGVVNGVTASTYSPSAYIKRGDFILMLYRAYRLKADFTGNFADVPKTSYYYTAIGVAKALGIAQGQGDNKFNPDGYLTRQDALVLVLRTVEKAGVTLPASVALPNFADKGSISSYAQNAVNSLAKAGVVKGDTLGKINPLQNLSRAEMAVILFRVLNLK